MLRALNSNNKLRKARQVKAVVSPGAGPRAERIIVVDALRLRPTQKSCK